MNKKIFILFLGLLGMNASFANAQTKSADPMLGKAENFVGKEFELPLVGATIKIEDLKVTPSKKYADHPCNVNMNKILLNIAEQIIVNQSSGGDVERGYTLGLTQKYLATVTNTGPTPSVDCSGTCTAGADCCEINAMARVVIAPTSNYKFAKDIIGLPLKTLSGKEFEIESITHEDDAGKIVANECHVDLNQLAADFDGNVAEKQTATYKLQRIEINDGSHISYTYVCNGAGSNCTVKSGSAAN